MQGSAGTRGDLAGVDLNSLDRLVTEIHDLAAVPEQRQRLVHALRNLAHMASLVAEVLKKDAERSEPATVEDGHAAGEIGSIK